MIIYLNNKEKVPECKSEKSIIKMHEMHNKKPYKYLNKDLLYIEECKLCGIKIVY